MRFRLRWAINRDKGQELTADLLDGGADVNLGR